MIVDAAKSNAIVSSVVPDHMKERLLSQQQQQQRKHSRRRDSNGSIRSRRSSTLKTYLHDGTKGHHEEDEDSIATAPLADLFLDTTVLFADISGTSLLR